MKKRVSKKQRLTPKLFQQNEPKSEFEASAAMFVDHHDVNGVAYFRTSNTDVVCNLLHAFDMKALGWRGLMPWVETYVTGSDLVYKVSLEKNGSQRA